MTDSCSVEQVSVALISCAILSLTIVVGVGILLRHISGVICWYGVACWLFWFWVGGCRTGVSFRRTWRGALVLTELLR